MHTRVPRYTSAYLLACIGMHRDTYPGYHKPHTLGTRTGTGAYSNTSRAIANVSLVPGTRGGTRVGTLCMRKLGEIKAATRNSDDNNSNFQNTIQTFAKFLEASFPKPSTVPGYPGTESETKTIKILF
eukprot:3931961-Rhodomonas_salina.3